MLVCREEPGKEVATWTLVWSSCWSMPDMFSYGTGLPQGIIHQHPCIWGGWRQQWLLGHVGQSYTPSPFCWEAVEGLQNHYGFPPGKKPCPPTLLRCVVHVSWLLAPSGMQYLTWQSSKKGYPRPRAGSRTCHPVRGRQQQTDQLCGILEQIRGSCGEKTLKDH